MIEILDDKVYALDAINEIINERLSLDVKRWTAQRKIGKLAKMYPEDFLQIWWRGMKTLIKWDMLKKHIELLLIL